MERNRRPPGVEEALSSMLWTPYERTPTDSSDDEITSPCKTIRSKCNDNMNVSYSYSTTDRHLYPEPIRYSYPGYVPFMPKAFSGQAQEQLPSYENVENERHHRSLNTIASTGIYFIPPFTSYGSSMVNSFTDDFLQYQVRKSTYNNSTTTTTTTRQLQSSINATPTTINSNNNRFSSDFSSLNLNLPSSHCGSTNMMQTITRHGDLHFSKQSNDDQVYHYNHENIDDDNNSDNVRGTAITTQTTTNITREAREYVADLPDEFRVSKPLTYQSECLNRSRDFTQRPDGSHHTNNNFYTQTSHIQIVNASTSTAHVQFDLNSSESSKCIRNNEGTVMRLSVPAAVPAEGGNQTMFVSNDTITAIGRSDNSRILENGTLMGAIVPQPSLTIHVNQGDHNNQQQQDVVNQSSGISIVNCYRAVPVQIVNNCSGSSAGESMHVVNNLNAKCDNQMINDQVQVLNEVKCDSSNTMDTRNLQHRTYTSTEAQTDDLQESLTEIVTHPVQVHPNPIQCQTDISFAREQRRRDRRERRHVRNSRQQHIHPAPHSSLRPAFEILPDILNSHVPPPYTALTLAAVPPSQHQAVLVPPIITPLPVGPPEDGRYTFPLPIMRRSPSERSGKGCCGQWFAGPPLRAVIFVVALGGLACALGGAALGATGLAGPPTSHFTAALLMTGVGMILVTVSGAAWRMTAPGAPQCLGLGSGGDLGRCGRRPCSGRAPHGLLYPEFQHRPPPPSYQASMQEYRLRLLLLDRDRQSGAVRGASPPPTYRSNAGSLLRVPLTARSNAGGPGSEYSLPPSYRAQHQINNSRPSPQTVSGANGASDTAGVDSLNTSYNHDLPNNVSTDSAIAPQQLQIHHQQSQNQRHQRLQQNSITSDASPDSIKHHNVLVDVVNNTKISQICNNENSSLTTNQTVDRSHRKVIGTKDGMGNNVKGENSARKDLVTIVTISGYTDNDTAAGEMDILAHL